MKGIYHCRRLEDPAVESEGWKPAFARTHVACRRRERPVPPPYLAQTFFRIEDTREGVCRDATMNVFFVFKETGRGLTARWTDGQINAGYSRTKNCKSAV